MIKIDFELLKKVMNLVKEAGKIATHHKHPKYKEKDQGNYVTEVDIAIQDFLASKLSELEPGFGFICEEKDLQNSKQYNWVIDPIDGTTNYLYGFDYSISVSLESEDTGHLGVVYIPTKKLFYVALKGEGAYISKGNKFTKLPHLSERKVCGDGILIFGNPYNRNKTKRMYSLALELRKDVADAKRIGPASLDIIRVAEGKARLYVEQDVKQWDRGGALVVLKEVGGRFIQKEDLSLFGYDELLEKAFDIY